MSPRQHGQMNTSLGLDEPCEIDERAALVLQPGVQAFSGARFEHVALADGRRLVLKRLPPEGDWLTRVTGGAGRARLLWDSGILAQVAATVDHDRAELLGDALKSLAQQGFSPASGLVWGLLIALGAGLAI